MGPILFCFGILKHKKGSIRFRGEATHKTKNFSRIYTTQNYQTDDFWPFQHLEMAVPVTELIPQQLGYFERGSAHTLELRSIYPLKDNRRRAVEKELVYIVYSCYTGYW